MNGVPATPPPLTRAEAGPVSRGLRLGAESLAFLASFATHLVALVLLAMCTLLLPTRQTVELTAAVPELEEELPPEEFRFSDLSQPEIGALAEDGLSEAAAAAPSEMLESEIVLDTQPVDDTGNLAAFDVERPILQGPTLDDNLLVKGVGAIGATGASGAIDRITNEIILSLDQRPTLVIWMFDASGSLKAQRAEIIKRFDRVYKELGVVADSGNPAFKDQEEKPLLTAVTSFGARLNELTAEPTDDVDEIKAAVRSVSDDDSGQENVFGAVLAVTNKYRHHRLKKPRRNVMLVIFSDEAGDDIAQLDPAVRACRTLEMPVFVVGVPAPFGRKESFVKYIDPDPKYDQSPQFLPVDQGPESLYPERIKLDYLGQGGEEVTLDSGFGPFGLTRLCFETGGAYFAVHPQRQVGRRVSEYETPPLTAYVSMFFDQRIMRRYRPDYVPVAEYERLLAANGARRALVQAARLSWTEPMEGVRLEFPKLDEAQFANDLSRAQREAAKLEPKLTRLVSLLSQGERDRSKLDEPRWEAGYDLALGRALATLVRTEGYNAMLARAKQGLKFKEEQSDTWVLRPSEEVSTGSVLAKQATAAKEYLERVLEEHPGTPWELLAKRELATPFGWSWEEEYNRLAERMAQAQNNANNPEPRPENLPPRKERRPPPKL